MAGNFCVRCNGFVYGVGSVCEECDKAMFSEPCEEKEIIKKEKHKDIMNEIHKLYVDKNGDYGDSFSKLYKEFGNTSSIIRLSDKLERLKTLNKGNERRVKDESIRDTLLDLCGYAVLTIMELDNE